MTDQNRQQDAVRDFLAFVDISFSEEGRQFIRKELEATKTSSLQEHDLDDYFDDLLRKTYETEISSLSLPFTSD